MSKFLSGIILFTVALKVFCFSHHHNHQVVRSQNSSVSKSLVYRTEPASFAEPVRLGNAYAVRIHQGKATFIPDDNLTSRWLLIVNSLGDPRAFHNVTFRIQPCSSKKRVHSSRLIRWNHEIDQKENSSKVLNTPRGSAAKCIKQENRLHDTDTNLDDNQIQTKARLFSFPVMDSSSPESSSSRVTKLKARRIAMGNRVEIYLDVAMRTHQLSAGLCSHLISLLEKDLLPLLESELGSITDVDRNGKLTIILTPAFSQLQGGHSSLKGFVRGSDFDPFADPTESNQSDLLYLNSNLKADSQLRSLLIHELTHAISFSQRFTSHQYLEAECGPFQIVPSSFRGAEEDWLNEGIAHAAEMLFAADFSNLDYRISRFLSHPNRYPLVISDYYRTGLWRSHGCRGATCLFLDWFLRRYGEENLRKLIHSPLSGTLNLEHQVQQKFESLFRDWSISLVHSTIPFSSEPDIEIHRNLALHGCLNEWGLIGPRIDYWNVKDHQSYRLQIAGTASVFVELDLDLQQESYVEIEGTEESRLQLTLIPLEEQPFRVTGKVAWRSDLEPQERRQRAIQTASRDHSFLDSYTLDRKRPDSHHLEMDLEIDNPEHGSLNIQQFSIEWNQGEVFCSRLLDPSEIILVRKKQKLSSPEECSPVLEYRVKIDVPLKCRQIPAVVKISLSDQQGRRFVLWKDLPSLQPTVP